MKEELGESAIGAAPVGTTECLQDWRQRGLLFTRQWRC